MKITILEPCGYCSGVERAMDIAFETKMKNPSKNVVILGMLVHNEDSLLCLEKAGINTVFKENCSLEQMVDEIKEPSIVILTAHGHSKTVEEKLIKNGHEIVDSTCPFVKNSFKEIQEAIKDGYEVFYIGVNNHPEAIAAESISSKVHLIDVKERLAPASNYEKVFVLSQTTLSEFEVKEVIDLLKPHYPDMKVAKGICNASTKRQESLMNIPNDIDGILIVGGNNSNNSKTLFNLAKKLYPNKIVKLIQNELELNKKDLPGLSHIAISSGASTPKEVVLAIKERLLN